MRIFLTGATGYIGFAVARALRDRGHDVAGLVRPDAEARRLRDAGVVIVAGDLSTLPTLAPTLTDYDAFVHTAFSHKDSVALDKNAVDVFTSARGHFIYTSGVWVLGNTDRADESTKTNPLALVAWRVGHEQQVISGGGAALRPGCVYGGKQSMLAEWFAAAEQRQPIRIVGDGKNRWAMVDLDDLAACYVRAVESRAKGVLHAIDDTHRSLNDCARLLTEKIEHTPADQAREKLGPFVDALTVDQVISSEKTRRNLQWTPKRTFFSSVEEQRREWRALQRV
ncbi:MAG TPA: NAD-dependent epimerase/dehydratase family protein [Thermoanaerobaculia bacterium]